MNFGFNEKELNFDDIENDSELLAELASLGWNHDHDRKPISTAVKHPKPLLNTSKVLAQAKPIVLSHQQSTQLEINKLIINNNDNDDDNVDYNE